MPPGLVEGPHQWWQKTASWESCSGCSPVRQRNSQVFPCSGQGVKGFKRARGGLGNKHEERHLSEFWFPPLENGNNATASQGGLVLNNRPPLLLFLLSKLAAQTARSLRHRQHPIQNIYLALAVCSALREKRPAASVLTPGNETLVRSEKYL